MDVTVVVATYGGDHWHDLAWSRAIPSVAKLDVPVMHSIGASLHDARNSGLDQVTSEWVCFLDADDELEPGYFDRMDEATADLRVPSVRYVRDGVSRPARMPKVAGHIHTCTPDCLDFGNWMVIGTVAPAALLREVGGFRDFDWSEDWDLWVRCWKAGASIEAVPKAVYRAHVRKDSRNRAPAREIKHAVHQQIAQANGLPVPT